MIKDIVIQGLTVMLSINCVIESVLFDLINKLDKEETND